MRRRFTAILWILFGVLLLGGLYWSLKFWLGEHEAVEPRSHTYRLVISASHPLVPPPVFRARQEDSVTFIFNSDRPGEAYVHGYEQKVVLKPRGEVSLTFTASYAGLFAIHLHDPDGSMHGLATLEVQPR